MVSAVAKSPVIFLMSATLMMPLVGCETSGPNQTAGTVIGGLGGAAVGALGGAAVGGRTGAVIGAIAGGVLGGWAGSTIGKRLDERDRQQASVATTHALDQPVRQTRSASGQTSTRGQPVNWRSNHTDNRGRAQVVSVNRTTSGAECRQVREIAYVSGEEVAQNSRYCKDESGRWSKVA